MKKIGTLNSEISKVISDLGHTDMIAIGDAGLPIPSHVKKIDLALSLGIPSFLDVLKEIEENVQVESLCLADEIKYKNKNLYEMLEKQYLNKYLVTFISHEDLKNKLNDVKAVIRTGENTPYANIIIKSGVIF